MNDLTALELPAASACRSLAVRTLRAGTWSDSLDMVAEEVPVAFEYNGISHAVMMASPSDLQDFGVGFSLSEEIVSSASQVHDIEVSRNDAGYTLHLQIAASCFAQLKDRRRSLTGRTGCGICGTESLGTAVRRPAPLSAGGPRFSCDAIVRAVAHMRDWQQLAAATGSTHAALWSDARGDIQLAREDVGRHNALDKLAGALALGKVPAPEGFILVTSRASYEMVQKAATAGVSLLAAVSGVTGLAVEVAQKSGLTLAGFARSGNLSVYSHPARIAMEPAP